MCGLLSVIGKGCDEQKFRQALKTLHHRGPDESGVHIDGLVTLGHTRLSIIDLKTGQQPLYNEDRSLVLICNGELYDFERIKTELIEKGHRFASGSDSEIILHLYEEYGENMYQHLRGEFAFVLLDKGKNKVIACRDRFGIKPLYYTKGDAGIVFSSEVKAIFATGLLKPKIDAECIRNTLSFYPKGVIFENVEILPPAHSITVDLNTGNFQVSKYWSMDLPNYQTLDSQKSFDQIKKETLALFEESVRLRLRSDVPVGVYLSGGIDSSAIIGTLAKLGTKNIKAFSISFSEDKQFDESTLASQMAEKAGAEYFQVNATKQKLLDNFEQMLWHTELPTHNLHGVGKFLLSDLARKHVTVCLTGEGADEVFLGYDYFKLDEKTGTPKTFGNASGRVFRRDKKRNEKFLKRFKFVKNALGIQPMTEIVMNFASKGFLNSIFAEKHRMFLAENNVLKKISREIDRDETNEKGSIAQLQYFSISKLMATYILNMLGDRQEMAHSIEGRTPFLDHHLFEYARSIPLRYKIKGNDDEKHILKEIVKDRVIEAVYQRHKWPYFAPSIPIKKGDNPTMDRLISTYMSKQAINDAGVFDYTMIRRIFFWSRPVAIIFPQIHARLNSLLTTVLSVQILHSQFCKPSSR